MADAASANLEDIRRWTEEAYREAGIEDFDLSYLTEDFIQEGLREARSAEEVLGKARVDPLAEAAGPWGNMLFKVWFQGGPGTRVYGYLTRTQRTCGPGTWYTYLNWRRRQLMWKCSDKNDYIWQISPIS